MKQNVRMKQNLIQHKLHLARETEAARRDIILVCKYHMYNMYNSKLKHVMWI